MEDSKTTIARKVMELAAEQAGVSPDTITIASHFVNDLNFDSLDTVEFAMEVEDEFEVAVPDEKVEDLHTIGDVVEFLVEKANTRCNTDNQVMSEHVAASNAPTDSQN